MTTIGVWLLRPVEKFWTWQWERAWRKGRYLRPLENSQCVTTAVRKR